MAISKRLRFEILKRDGFRCRYCGASPVECQLEVDHIVAVSRGGSNEPQNLATACDRCNGGKSDIPLAERLASPLDIALRLQRHAGVLATYVEAREVANLAETRVFLNTDKLRKGAQFPFDALLHGFVEKIDSVYGDEIAFALRHVERQEIYGEKRQFHLFLTVLKRKVMAMHGELPECLESDPEQVVH